MDINQEEFARRIIELRNKKGLTQKDLATMINNSDKSVSKWERGEGLPGNAYWLDLANILGVSVDYLMTGKNTIDMNSIENIEDIIQSCLVDDILDVKKLLNITNNYKIIKDAVNTYHIHAIEKYFDLIISKDWKKIYKFAIDNGIDDLVRLFVDGEIDRVESVFVGLYWSKQIFNCFSHYGQISYTGINGEYILMNENKSDYDFRTVEEIKSYLVKVRKNILANVLNVNQYMDTNKKQVYIDDLDRGYPKETIVKLGDYFKKVLSKRYLHTDDLSSMYSSYCGDNSIKYNVYDEKSMDKDTLMIKHFIKIYKDIEDDIEIKERILPVEVRKCIDYIFDIK